MHAYDYIVFHSLYIYKEKEISKFQFIWNESPDTRSRSILVTKEEMETLKRLSHNRYVNWSVDTESRHYPVKVIKIKNRNFLFKSIIPNYIVQLFIIIILKFFPFEKKNESMNQYKFQRIRGLSKIKINIFHWSYLWNIYYESYHLSEGKKSE